jgi:hypothetical protein
MCTSKICLDGEVERIVYARQSHLMVHCFVRPSTTYVTVLIYNHLIFYSRDYVDGDGASALDGAAPPEPWGQNDNNNGGGGEGLASDHKKNRGTASTAPRLFKVRIRITRA